MEKQESRKRNRKVGIILALVFVGIFTISTVGLVFGFEAPPSIKKIVYWSTTVIAGAIGVFLIGAPLVEFIVKIVKRRIRRVRNDGT
jgi:ethanolamine transporter EutH